MLKITLYDQENIHQLVWPVTEQAASAKAYLIPLIENGVSSYITNVTTQMRILAIDDLILPLTINAEEYGNSYVCSPYTHYISCAIQESSLMTNRLLRTFSTGFMEMLGKALRYGKINKIVSVNNWLLPTNLYPVITQEQVKRITTFLSTTYPDHTIVFRSLNVHKEQALLSDCEKVGYQKVLARYIYFLDTQSPNVLKANMFKKDLNILQKSPYKIIELPQADSQEVKRILSLYRAIYLEKYTEHNPQFTTKFVELIVKSRFLKLKALKLDGRIDGVFGHYAINDVMTMPFFGYDTTLPLETGLYRKICALMTLEAKESKSLLNLSAGAASYKRLRRAEGSFEYSAVYHQHLPLRRKMPWFLLRVFVNGFGSRVMQKF